MNNDAKRYIIDMAKQCEKRAALSHESAAKGDLDAAGRWSRAAENASRFAFEVARDAG